MVRRPGITPGRSMDSGVTIRLASLANYRRMKWVEGRGLDHDQQAYETRRVAATAAVRIALRADVGAIAHGALNLPAIENCWTAGASFPALRLQPPCSLRSAV
jgi:hypothetical protein